MGLQGRIITVPLDVYRRENEEYIKTSQLQVKIQNKVADGEKSYSLLFACQEGIYGSELSPVKIKRCKSKKDIGDSEWLQLFESLFTEDLLADDGGPEGFETAEIAGKLDSLENYDPETGELTEGDLADEAPALTIFIRSRGKLSVEYGSFQAQVKEAEEDDLEGKREIDILNWVLLQSNQLKLMAERLRGTDRELKEAKEDAKDTEEEIKQTIDDYNLILRDLEDRFYQVLNAKRQKILELLGDDMEDLKHLNETFEVNNRTNLNRVRIEEIIKSEGFKAFEEKEKERENARASKKRGSSGTRNPPKKRKTAKKEPSRRDLKVEKDAIKQEEVLNSEEEELRSEEEEKAESDDIHVKEEPTDVLEDTAVEGEASGDEAVSEREHSPDHSEDATDYSDEDTQVKREDDSSTHDMSDKTQPIENSQPSEEEEQETKDEDEEHTDYSD